MALKTGLSGVGTQAWSCRGACPRGTKETEPENGGRNCLLSPDDLKHLDQTIPAYRCRKHPFLLQLLRFFFHCDKRWPFHDHLLTPEHVSPGALLPTVTPLYPQGSDKYNFFHHISRHNCSSLQARWWLSISWRRVAWQGEVEMARAQAGLPLANQPSTMYHPPPGGFRCKDYGKREYNFLIK